MNRCGFSPAGQVVHPCKWSGWVRSVGFEVQPDVVHPCEWSGWVRSVGFEVQPDADGVEMHDGRGYELFR